MDDSYDVVVIGGGAAGLSGAVALARSRRTVLVVDAGEPRNAAAAGVHNYLGREGARPADLLADGRAELAGYGGHVASAVVTAALRADDGSFRVTLGSGRGVSARRLLVATGLVDELPALPGLADRWGRDVLHCPYCHGWEVRDQAIGILATGPTAVHQALLFRQLSADVTFFRHTGPELAAEDADSLAALGIPIVDGEVAGIEVTGDRLTGVRLVSGEVVPRAAVVVAPRFTARAHVLAGLGLAAADQEMRGAVVGSAVPADPTGATEVPGVWVAGNVSDLSAQVVVSAAAGMRAGAMINADLVAEDARRAVAQRRSRAA
jgi:thioredoxin reductase